jgi:hypothetical protein
LVPDRRICRHEGLGRASECPLIPLGVNIRQTIDPDIGDIHNAVIGADCLSAVWKGHNGP